MARWWVTGVAWGQYCWLFQATTLGPFQLETNRVCSWWMHWWIDWLMMALMLGILRMCVILSVLLISVISVVICGYNYANSTRGWSDVYVIRSCNIGCEDEIPDMVLMTVMLSMATETVILGYYWCRQRLVYSCWLECWVCRWRCSCFLGYWCLQCQIIYSLCNVGWIPSNCNTVRVVISCNHLCITEDCDIG